MLLNDEQDVDSSFAYKTYRLSSQRSSARSNPSRAVVKQQLIQPLPGLRLISLAEMVALASISLSANSVAPVSGNSYTIQNIGFGHWLDNANSALVDGNPILAWSQSIPGTNNQTVRLQLGRFLGSSMPTVYDYISGRTSRTRLLAAKRCSLFSLFSPLSRRRALRTEEVMFVWTQP